MFILYGVAAGLVVGLVSGGRIGRLADLRIRWAWLAIAGLAVQVLLFLTPVGDALGPVAPWAYAGSTAAILAVILANLRVPGLAIVAVGAASNLLAIVANGGYMPVSPGALATLGWEEPPGYSNSAAVGDPSLAPLTDIFAMPPWLPFANVFSIGDVLIAIGIAATIALAMRRAPREA
ncbi:MAG: DUF5317 domain-containing protein [Chloroflexi bacterium]|jgi:hypothetical protein|nr:DUF5317 domain-containing protein [Chloroflexota bacterium]